MINIRTNLIEYDININNKTQNMHLEIIIKDTMKDLKLKLLVYGL